MSEETTKPKIGNKDKKKAGIISANPADVMKVARVAVTEGQEAARSSDIDEANAIMDQLEDSAHAFAESAKPTIRQKVNSFRNTTLGTVLETGAIIVGGCVGFYVVQGGIRSRLRDRKERKLVEAEAAMVAATEAALLAD